MDRQVKKALACEGNRGNSKHTPEESFTTEEIINLLAVKYGPAIWKPRLNPFSELIATILSQHTSDLNNL